MVRDDLIFMSQEQLVESFLHKRVRIVLNDDQIEEFIVKEYSFTPHAFNGACPVVGFVSQSGRCYSFLAIKEIYIIFTDTTQIYR